MLRVQGHKGEQPFRDLDLARAAVTVSVLAPDRVVPASGTESSQINLFLYLVTPNTGWRNESFRGYADWMRTEAFRSALESLVGTRHETRLALDEPFRNYVLHHNARVAPPYDWSEIASLHLGMYAHAAGRR